MPYTPPSHNRSPASSAPSSPDASRRPSFHQGQNGSSRPVLPRSASYLTKHRRTPSAVSGPSPEATSEDLKGMLLNSVRQSPPPITGDRGMPKGAIISPPDSSSDDEDLPEVSGRGRQIENLKELHDAISQIPQHRESSPDKSDATEKEAPDAADMLVRPSQASAISEGMHHSFSMTSLDGLAVGGKRRISHSRSITEPNLLIISKSANNSLTGSEEDSEDEMQRKPQMVRKKSGELVRPALRPPSRRRPSSMPGTPTFSKAVHFDSHLEHVRHFLKIDRPLAVSAGSSPVDNYESDNEYPFGAEDRAVRSPPFEWEILMPNFPVETPIRKAQPVRLERVWLSPDQKCLIGSVVVANLAFQKHVTCRFTLDYWKTTSEVAAEYVSVVRPQEGPMGHDRFNFTIKLSDLANLEAKTLYFCIRYNVNGQEYWDNNGGTNFQVDFRKKMLPQNGKKGVIGATARPANGLPKSTRRPNPSTAPRPKSMPVGADDFGDSAKLNFDQSIHEYLGETGPTSLRLKSTKSAANLPSDNLSSRLSAPSGQAFANRYDFGASLTAAMQAAKDSMSGKPDGLYMKSHRRAPAPVPVPVPNLPKDSNPKEPTFTNGAPALVKASTVPGRDSLSAGISSSSYEELVNKYCFFGSKQSSPQLKDGTLPSGRYDGADDNLTTRSTNSSSNASSNGSPIQMGNYQPSHQHGAQHHTLHPNDPNPYFQHGTSFMNIGASPSESPLSTLAPQLLGSPLNGPSRAPTASGQPPNRSSSPAVVGNFGPLAGTSSPNEYTYQHLHDRFPFFGPDAHTPTAIRG